MVNSKHQQYHHQGVKSPLQPDILPHPYFFQILIFFSKISVPFPSFSLDILPKSLNIIGKIILHPLSLPLFKTWYSSRKDLRNSIHPWKFPYLPVYPRVFMKTSLSFCSSSTCSFWLLRCSNNMCTFNQWLNDWTNEWMNEWMNEWINEWMNEWMNEWISE